jgi:NADPH-dependent 2,4-dienoyl-CoA reductase/sulfur reductase-like enzyme
LTVQASSAISEGLIDMVGMTRARMADPHIVAKILRGEEARIRPCVGVGYCIDRIYEGGEALCLHNPATGREATMPHVIARAAGPTRKVVVVGAGPAGLEAARVAAAHGHPVVLLEAAPQPGGQVRLAAALGRRREIIGITDWLAGEIRHLGVDLRCNLLAEASDVIAEAPDVVVIATGGVPDSSFLAEGADLVVTPWDILSGQVAPARDVLLFDGQRRASGRGVRRVPGAGRRKARVRDPRAHRPAGDRRDQLSGVPQGVRRASGDDHAEPPAAQRPP